MRRPAAIALLGAGVLVLAWLSRRRSHLRPIGYVMSQTNRLPAERRAAARKRMFKLLYDGLRRGARGGDVGFLNYGYAPEGQADGSLELPSEREADRYAMQLYDRVASAVPLRGLDVLEVGCGRGGGAAFVFERHEPRALTGLDLSDVAVAYCRRRYGRVGLQFVAGDAERLPFADASFDAVLNVESSHCYPNVGVFLTEVARVLRPGGVLLFADMRPTESGGVEGAEDVAILHEQIGAAGFLVVEEEDITADVVRALTRDTPRRRAEIERLAPRLVRTQVLEFAGVEGSELHRAFSTREATYLRMVLRRGDDLATKTSA